MRNRYTNAASWALVSLLATSAYASPTVEQLTESAYENIELEDYDDAGRTVAAALAVAKEQKLLADPKVIPIYLAGAISEIRTSGNKEAALRYLSAAARIDKDVAFPAGVSDAALTELLVEAKVRVGAIPRPKLKVDCGKLMGLAHQPIAESDEKTELEFDVFVSNGIKPAAVTLKYRLGDSGDFTDAAMKRAEGCRFSVKITSDVVTGDSFEYYIAVTNKAGKPLAQRGSDGNPNKVHLNKKEVEWEEPESKDAEEKPESFDFDNPDSVGAETEPVQVETPEPKDNEKPKSKRKSRDGMMFVNVTMGSGAGFVSGRTEQVDKEVQPGLAPAWLHVAPEFGVFLSDRLAISGVVRLGITVGANLPGKATNAPSVMARARYWLADSFHVSGSLGIGAIRHTIELDTALGVDMDTDTAASGPVIAGGGAAYTTPLTETMSFVAEANVLMGIPVTDAVFDRASFGVNLDLSVGVLFGF